MSHFHSRNGGSPPAFPPLRREFAALRVPSAGRRAARPGLGPSCGGFFLGHPGIPATPGGGGVGPPTENGLSIFDP